ncbi:MAG: acyl carrier protein, partial [Candidatus Mariimomonas ferrooxydans]
MEQVHVNDNFFDLGGSSLIAVNLFTHIEKTFGRRLPPTTPHYLNHHS